MSRLSQIRPTTTTTHRPANATSSPATTSQQDDICPVCKSSRYLTPSLRFLINPECYHKMCDSCVDRIFSHGPAPCPIPGCHKTLRKARFRTPTFSDLQVEREVDIRRRVAAVFNRREEEFEDLRAWNDYLNEVEDITFNLVHRVDLEQTEKRFDAYRRAHEAEIETNRTAAEQERADFAALQREERDLARRRREAARREEAEERREMEEGRRDVLNRLAQGQDAEKVVGEEGKVQLKKRMDRAAAAERQRRLQAAAVADGSGQNGSSGLVIKGLRAKQKAEPDAPIDPFGGLMFKPQYYTPQEKYVWAGVQESKADVMIGAGGYDVDAFTQRALTDAFAGLGVFAGEESDERERLRLGGENAAVATKGAETAAVM